VWDAPARGAGRHLGDKSEQLHRGAPAWSVSTAASAAASCAPPAGVATRVPWWMARVETAEVAVPDPARAVVVAVDGSRPRVLQGDGGQPLVGCDGVEVAQGLLEVGDAVSEGVTGRG
jgi:hypothetical protein